MFVELNKVNRFVDYTGFPDILRVMEYPDGLRMSIRTAMIGYLEEHIERLSNESDIAYLRKMPKGH